MFIAMIATISSVSANDMYSPGNFDDMDVTKVVVRDSDTVISGKSKFVVVNLNEKVKFLAETTVGVQRVNWNFSDKTQIKNTETKNQKSIVTHSFKKRGTYKIKVDLEKTVINASNNGTHSFNPTYNYSQVHIVTVKVVEKADLIVTSISYPRNSKNVGSIIATVKNKGGISSKACKISVWYKDKKLKQYTKTASVPKLKPGKSTQIRIKFQIPHKYKEYIKYARVDSNSVVDESIKSNNRRTFK